MGSLSVSQICYRQNLACIESNSFADSETPNEMPLRINMSGNRGTNSEPRSVLSESRSACKSFPLLRFCIRFDRSRAEQIFSGEMLLRLFAE